MRYLVLALLVCPSFLGDAVAVMGAGDNNSSTCAAVERLYAKRKGG